MLDFFFFFIRGEGINLLPFIYRKVYLMIAYLIKEEIEKYIGYANLYRLVPSFIDGDKEIKFIVVSAVSILMDGYETYIFESDEFGVVLNWNELNGSVRGVLDHELALSNFGYIVDYSEWV